MPGPSVFPSGEPGVSGDFWVNALSLLGQQVIASSASAVSSLASLSSTQGCPGVSQRFSRISYSLFQSLEEELCFVF